MGGLLENLKTAGGDGRGPITRQSVFEEAMEMLTGALLIYIFADIREMAREGDLTIPLSELEPPISMDQMIVIIDSNKEALLKRAVDHEELKTRIESLKSIKAHEGSMLKLMLGEVKTTTRLTHFHDENSSNEMVHGIAVNDVRQRVTVVFRGSVTQQDFVIDAKCQQKKVANPAAELSAGGLETINIHSGFHEYLFRKKDKAGKGRLERILEDVRVLLRENPGYRLYCTGHSLGGALSTLCGFYAAADEDFTKNGPVTVVSIASPLVGNMKFRLAFQTLERQKKLQHLRISNKEDMVTLVPFAVPKITALSPVLAAKKGVGNLYKHCGMRIKLKSVLDCKDVPYTIIYAKDHSDDEAYTEELKQAKAAGKSLLASLLHVVKKDFAKVTAFHSCEEYEARLETCKKYLVNFTLDDLYNNRDIVGSLLDQEHQPEMKKLSFTKRASIVMKSGRKPRVQS